MCVSWDDAQAYVSWLSRKTGKPYRLPSEAEWEYAARGGTAGSRYWADASAASACKYASVAANAYGLHDMLGNVWEWVEDCWNQGYAGAPGQSVVRSTGTCDIRVFRGGAWNSKPATVRAAYRDRDTKDERHENLGFRVARH